jgi:hypothetical protein
MAENHQQPTIKLKVVTSNKGKFPHLFNKGNTFSRSHMKMLAQKIEFVD